MADVRIAGFQNYFYPSHKKELEEEIEGYLKKAEIGKKFKDVKGIIAPHAGYGYSGQTAAFSYKAISDCKIETFIILGTSHGSSVESALTFEDFKTPLGIAENDLEFSKELQKEGVMEDKISHRGEHSIEVQLPFIQKLFPKAKIVPIVVLFSGYAECMAFVNKIAKVAKKIKRKICIVASGDMSHYGPAYGFVPFPPEKEKIYSLDKEAIKLMEKMDGEGFFDYAKETTICGIFAFTATIELCKKLGAKKVSLLNYSNSGEISGDFSNCVGYASIVFE